MPRSLRLCLALALSAALLVSAAPANAGKTSPREERTQQMCKQNPNHPSCRKQERREERRQSGRCRVADKQTDSAAAGLKKAKRKLRRAKANLKKADGQRAKAKGRKKVKKAKKSVKKQKRLLAAAKKRAAGCS